MGESLSDAGVFFNKLAAPHRRRGQGPRLRLPPKGMLEDIESSPAAR